MSETLAPKIRCAIYTRQSVNTPTDFASCDAQFETCLQRIHKEGEDLVWVGVRFDDRGESGGTLDRPAMRRLRSAVADRTVDRVYVTGLDRLSRSVRDMAEVFEEFEAAGVQVHLAQSVELLYGANTRFIRNVLASFAEFEREMIASRIADTRAAMKQQGKRLAGLPPFGYAADARTRQLKQVLIEANQVRAIYKLAAGGARPSEIAAKVNARGWRTKQYVAQRSGRTHGGRPWTARQIVELLRNPVYVGLFRDGKGTRLGRHLPIVDAALFDAAQGALDSRRTTTAPRGRIATWPLRGKLMCPRCHRAMTSYMVTVGNNLAKKVYRYYRCRATGGGQPPCRGVQFPAHAVEQCITRMLSDTATWQRLLRQRPGLTHRAAELRETWIALDDSEQERLMDHFVASVRLDDQRGTMSVDFAPALFDLVARALAQSRSRPRPAGQE